ncbi:conserved membrane hypothetical protein [Pseudomonas sp. 8AS]|uniref:hypothetical protein n=1 Tax=Pseudomonas sp. 8AS TaxID=2653163 RepID=UPI0012F194AD|nr:hypothetical protein [Pseudomonas sp. 8AS]VXC06076.1 conserved membrane hypothetical protein [Pseudomonas sp. 8AS]
MQRAQIDSVSLLFFIFAAVFVGFAISGGYHGYSPVPFMDEWGGSLDFYIRSSSGDPAIWWAQHNEHRVVLSRLLFWMDFAWFGGSVWLLLAINYLLVALGCVVFWNIWREREIPGFRFVGFFLVAWLFSWSQKENLVWAFQSQFILAQLLPLVAFYYLHKCVAEESKANRYFALAILFGVLSVGSMTNGVLALPLMAVLAALMGLGWRRSGFLLLLAVLAAGAYFYDFVRPPNHGSLAKTLSEDPLGLIQYVLVYVGGPFYPIAKKLVGHGLVALHATQTAGLFLVLSALAFLVQELRKRERSTLQLALLTFILYIGGTALGTGGGRLLFGINQALSSRYMTPALMAWAALFMLYAPLLLKKTEGKRWKLWIPAFVLLAMLVSNQKKGLENKDEELFERQVAALAMELRVRDTMLLPRLYPNADDALMFSAIPVERDLSVFGLAPIRNAREHIGTQLASSTPTLECQGELEEIDEIEGSQTGYLRVQGWVFDPSTQSVPDSLSIVDTQTAKVIGFVITGQPQDANLKAARTSGFKGYLQGQLLTGAPDRKITLVNQASGCQFSTTLSMAD